MPVLRSKGQATAPFFSTTLQCGPPYRSCFTLGQETVPAAPCAVDLFALFWFMPLWRQFIIFWGGCFGFRHSDRKQSCCRHPPLYFHCQLRFPTVTDTLYFAKAVCRGWLDVTSTLSTLLEPLFPASHEHVVTRASLADRMWGGCLLISPGSSPFFMHLFF